MGTVQEYRELFRDMREYGAAPFVVQEIYRLIPDISSMDVVPLIVESELMNFSEFLSFVSSTRKSSPTVSQT
jgi:hypothetical protein